MDVVPRHLGRYLLLRKRRKAPLSRTQTNTSIVASIANCSYKGIVRRAKWLKLSGKRKSLLLGEQVLTLAKQGTYACGAELRPVLIRGGGPHHLAGRECCAAAH